MSFEAAEADRRIAQMTQIGTVTAVTGDGMASVAIGDVATHLVPVMQLRAGGLSFWWMPTVGEQVLVIAPGGDMARALVVGSIFAGNAPSSDPATPMIDLAGGQLQVNGDIIVTGDVVASGISLVTHTHGGVQAGPSETGEPS